MPVSTFRLAKTIDGVMHYAEVTVSVEQSMQQSIVVSPSAFEWLRDVYGPEAFEWPICADYRVAAVEGAKKALEETASEGFSNSVMIEVQRIHAVVVDTSPDDVLEATRQAIKEMILQLKENPNKLFERTA